MLSCAVLGTRKQMNVQGRKAPLADFRHSMINSPRERRGGFLLWLVSKFKRHVSWETGRALADLGLPHGLLALEALLVIRRHRDVLGRRLRAADLLPGTLDHLHIAHGRGRRAHGLDRRGELELFCADRLQHAGGSVRTLRNGSGAGSGEERSAPAAGPP